MEDKIKGIALLLFGILLSCAQDGLNDTIFASMSDIPFAFVGLCVGIAGSALCLANQRTNNCHFVPGQLLLAVWPVRVIIAVYKLVCRTGS